MNHRVSAVLAQSCVERIQRSLVIPLFERCQSVVEIRKGFFNLGIRYRTCCGHRGGGGGRRGALTLGCDVVVHDNRLRIVIRNAVRYGRSTNGWSYIIRVHVTVTGIEIAARD